VGELVKAKTTCRIRTVSSEPAQAPRLRAIWPEAYSTLQTHVRADLGIIPARFHTNELVRITDDPAGRTIRDRTAFIGVLPTEKWWQRSRAMALGGGPSFAIAGVHALFLGVAFGPSR